jgi:hypothetical protein
MKRGLFATGPGCARRCVGHAIHPGSVTGKRAGAGGPFAGHAWHRCRGAARDYTHEIDNRQSSKPRGTHRTVRAGYAGRRKAAGRHTPARRGRRRSTYIRFESHSRIKRARQRARPRRRVATRRVPRSLEVIEITPRRRLRVPHRLPTGCGRVQGVAVPAHSRLIGASNREQATTGTRFNRFRKRV